LEKFNTFWGALNEEKLHTLYQHQYGSPTREYTFLNFLTRKEGVKSAQTMILNPELIPFAHIVVCIYVATNLRIAL